jgi:cytosine/adenosine deaminase-related metal-dependent hydrolase
LAENERYIRVCQNRHDGKFAALVGAHASFTLDEAAFAGCVDLAKRLGVGEHIHAAEDPVDEQLTREMVGCGLLDRFERHGLLDLPGTIIAHGTHFTDADIARVNKRRATITMAHNPRSNMNNGVGYAGVVRHAKPPMLGTDGIGADMWNEARIALFKSNDVGMPLPFGRPLEMMGESARYASRALGVKLGMLEVGAAADLVLTNYHPATPLSAESLAGHLIFAMGPEFARDAMIDGWWVLRNWHIVTCDEAAERTAAVEISRGLHARMAALPCD